MNEAAAAKPGWTMAVYKRRFEAGGYPARVTIRSRMDGLHSELVIDGRVVATDHTPAAGPAAVRNHRLTAALPDRTSIEVEAGYISLWSVGIAVRHDGQPIHESHPGREIAYPEKYRKSVEEAPGESIGALFKKGVEDGKAEPGIDLGVYKRNKVPIAVDISLAVLFYVIAKMTDLSTAAVIGAVVGIGLVVAQRFIKTDIIGGMALFSVVMMLVSAGLAIVYQTDDAVKMRTTIVGLIGAAFFLGDGLLLRGRRIGAGLARYLPYNDIRPERLAIGMGALGLVMAGLNYGVAKVASTDFWLIYHSVLDIFVGMLLTFGVFKYARTGVPIAARPG